MRKCNERPLFDTSEIKTISKLSVITFTRTYDAISYIFNSVPEEIAFRLTHTYATYIANISVQ